MKPDSSIPSAFRDEPTAADVQASARARTATLLAVQATLRAKAHLRAVASTVKDWNIFVGLCDVVRHALPDTRMAREDLALALGLPIGDLHLLAGGSLSPLDVEPDAIVRLSTMLGLPQRTVWFLVHRDVQRIFAGDDQFLPEADIAIRVRLLEREFRSANALSRGR